MGMNMVSKGVQNVLDYLQNEFPDMDVIGISGEHCISSISQHFLGFRLQFAQHLITLNVMWPCCCRKLLF